jgi:hypothetical protein
MINFLKGRLMKRILLLFFTSALFLFFACDNKEPDTNEIKSDVPAAHVVKVVEHMNASNYTYIKVEEKDKEYWIAVPQMEVEEGAVLYFTKSMEMKNFRSETLNRTFESILFVDDISATPHTTKNISAHPEVQAGKEDVKVEPLKDGYTIAKIFQQKGSLTGKSVKVRGKVTKFNEDIMGRNWIHIQDGTGDKNQYDLVVTSDQKAEVGKIVTVEGVLAADKDFGSGYTYSVLIENASIKVE